MIVSHRRGDMKLAKAIAIVIFIVSIYRERRFVCVKSVTQKKAE